MIMVDKEDLRLSLSLTCSKPQINHVHTSNSLSPNLNSLPPANLPFAFAAPQRTPWIDYSFASSADLTIAGEPRSFPNGIDVNAAIAEDEEAGVSSPNSTISSASGKRSEREAIDDQEDEDGDTSRKKLRLSKDQSAVLEESFKENHTLNPKQKLTLSKRLGLRPRQVEVWFQNRRARTKLKQTEFDCEFMRKCCEQLTEENRRLQKEVQELRSLKLSPQFYMQMSPPTTLTMCPSCERVAAAPSSGHAQRRLPVNPWGVQIGQV